MPVAALMPADPEQELDGNVMPLSACLAAVTKHENGICLSLVVTLIMVPQPPTQCIIPSTAVPDVVPDIAVHL